MHFGTFAVFGIIMDANDIMNADDRAYYLRRALQEHEAARMATCPQARERHEELAAAYRLRSGMDALQTALFRDCAAWSFAAILDAEQRRVRWPRRFL